MYRVAQERGVALSSITRLPLRPAKPICRLVNPSYKTPWHARAVCHLPISSKPKPYACEFPVRWMGRMSEREQQDDQYPRLHDIFIIGAGCIGQGLTASLIRNNLSNRVFLISKTEHIHKIQTVGMNLMGVIEESFKPGRRFVVSDKIDNGLLSKYRVHQKPTVFLSTKASDAVSSLDPFKSALSTLCPTVICLQNGLGIEQEVARVFPPFHAKVLKGHVFGAVHKKMDSIFAYKGRIIVGSNNEEITTGLKTIFGPPDSSIFNLEVSSNILQAIYPKVAVNCVCNPLTVILNKNLGFIRANYEPLIRMICSEVYVVAHLQGINLSSSEDLAEIVLDTMFKFSSHYSSMHLDHQSGRATEIDYINGAIVKIANEKMFHAPLNKLLVKAMK